MTIKKKGLLLPSEGSSASNKKRQHKPNANHRCQSNKQCPERQRISMHNLRPQTFRQRKDHINVLDHIQLSEHGLTGLGEFCKVGGKRVVDDSRANGDTNGVSDTVDEDNKASSDGHVLGIGAVLTGEDTVLIDESLAESQEQYKDELLCERGVFVEEDEETDGEGEGCSAKGDEAAVVFDLCEEEAGCAGGENSTKDGRHETEARVGDGCGLDDLEVEGDVKAAAVKDETREEVDGDEEGDFTIEEEVHGDDGLCSTLFDKDEDDDQDAHDAEERDNDGRVPSVGSATPVQWQE